MNSVKNKVQLIGNLGKDAEIKQFDNGGKLARLSLAVDESYKNQKGERISDTSWHNIVAGNGLADIAEKYLKKGSRVCVEGKLVNRSWEDKEGNKHFVTEIRANEILMLDSKQSN